MVVETKGASAAVGVNRSESSIKVRISRAGRSHETQILKIRRRTTRRITAHVPLILYPVISVVVARVGLFLVRIYGSHVVKISNLINTRIRYCHGGREVEIVAVEFSQGAIILGGGGGLEEGVSGWRDVGKG